MRSWVGVALVAIAACGGDDSSGTPDAPGGADAAVDAPPSGPPARYAIARGVAGAERLYAVDGARVVEISTGAGEAWCGGRVFCNLPPNGSVGRFPFVRYLGPDRVIYVELDPVDWSRSKVVVADAATGAQTELAGAVTWPAATPDWPINYVVAAAANGSTVWVSLPIAGGMGLFRSDDGAPLAPVATTPMPSGRTYMESHVAASAAGVVWSVRWRAGVVTDDPYEFRSVILDASGAVRWRIPGDIPGAVDGADESYLVDGTVAVHWERGDGATPLELYDLATGQRRPIAIANGYVASTGPGGDGLVAIGRAGSNMSSIVDAATGEAIDEIVGQSWGVEDGHVIYRRNTPPLELVERDPRVQSERVLAPDTSIGYNAMGGVFAPDRHRLAVVDGTPFLDLNDNVGVAIVDRATLERNSIEPGAPSEEYTRQLTWTADSQWLLYVHPVGDTLQLAAYQVTTGRREILTSGSEHVRQIAVPSVP